MKGGRWLSPQRLEGRDRHARHESQHGVALSFVWLIVRGREPQRNVERSTR